jgi:hypothetical protein
MPIDLHPACKIRVVELIAAALPFIEVDNGKYLKRTSDAVSRLLVADEALPQRGAVHDSLMAYIDEYPILEFVHDTLTDELRNAAYAPESEGQRLSTIPGYENINAVASRLVDEFVSLPREYKLTFRLPNDLWPTLPLANSMHQLGPSMCLVRSSAELSESFTLKSEKSSPNLGLLALLDTAPRWEEGALYLQMSAQGFIGGYGGTIPDLDARRSLRSFCGLGLALQLFGTNARYIQQTPRSTYFAHQKHRENEWLLRGGLELDDSLSRGLERLSMNTAAGWINSPERQDLWSKRILDEMSGVYMSGVRSEPILLASQWFFDSATGSDPLLQYIQAMVVLEILLGDKATSKEIGLNELLRNRCAYLIGSSQEDRAELYKVFGEIYEVRSQIVHRGKHRLNMTERSLLSRLRRMCQRVIQKEVDLLIADNKKVIPTGP